jgi:hypothetical protein
MYKCWYKKIQMGVMLLLLTPFCWAQVQWINSDSLFAPLPAGLHVFKSTSAINGRPSIAYYVSADLKNRALIFDVDTSSKRRLTPQQFFTKNKLPAVVVNTTFFSFATNQNLNAVIKNGRLVSYNVHTIAGRGKDTLTYRHPLGSAIGISKKRKVDVAWLFTDSARRKAWAIQWANSFIRDSIPALDFNTVVLNTSIINGHQGEIAMSLKKWKVKTAVGGGPVLLQNGVVQISNNEELKFAGKAVDDKHPRTAMGYTSDGKLIIMVVEGRNPRVAEGVSLTELAQLLKEVNCTEALNLDGGGSSCMLINGKPTIKVSDKEGQRPVPAVFIIKTTQKH